jgi:hypothetical protein
MRKCGFRSVARRAAPKRGANRAGTLPAMTARMALSVPAIGHIVGAARLALVAAALLLAGCSSPAAVTAYRVRIDPAFTADQVEAIMAGLDDWKVSLPELEVTADIGACGSPSAHEACVGPAHDARSPAADIIGLTTPQPSSGATVIIYVDRILALAGDPHRLTEQTMAHELGHVMGLRHAPPGELMAATVSEQAHSVTAADVAQFWAVRDQ